MLILHPMARLDGLSLSLFLSLSLSFSVRLSRSLPPLDLSLSLSLYAFCSILFRVWGRFRFTKEGLRGSFEFRVPVCGVGSRRRNHDAPFLRIAKAGQFVFSGSETPEFLWVSGLVFRV